ncbi:MAG: hypothetical protein U1F43_13050 [Myxococcota bacterium]
MNAVAARFGGVGVALALALGASACLDAPEYYYGENLTDVRFVIWTLDTGVHPSRAVLDDPSNPFRDHPPSADMKWQILSYGGDAAAFYAWATLLAIAPTGELQYYTAVTLERIARNGEVTAVEVPYVRQLALDAYASVLDNFPESVTYDATGTIAYRVAPLAYDAILALGGTPPPGWVRVATPDGGTTVIPIDAPPAAPAADEATP